MKTNILRNATAETAGNAPAETVTHNGVKIVLKRTETERVKEGKEAITYWTVDLDQFIPSIPENTPADKLPEVKATAYNTAVATVVRAMTGETLFEYLQAKLNQNLRSAQMDAGKDLYDMQTKLTYVRNYITGGFGATRQVQKSPMELAQGEFQTTMAALAEKRNAKLITPEQFTAQSKAALDALQVKLMEITTALATQLAK